MLMAVPLYIAAIAGAYLKKWDMNLLFGRLIRRRLCASGR